MEFQNVFKDTGLNSIIPFFSAIYLSFINQGLWLISLILVANTFAFYLIVMVYAKRITDKNRDNKQKSEHDIYKEVVNRDNYNPSAVTSIAHWIIGIITLILLYPYLQEAIAYSMFWLLIASFSFNFLRMFIVHWDIIKKAFKGGYL